MSFNGIISFHNSFTSITPQNFSDLNRIVDPVIVPLWADFDMNSSGPINYRYTENATTLDRISNMMQGVNPNLGDYEPALAVIVTWNSMQLRGGDGTTVCYV